MLDRTSCNWKKTRPPSSGHSVLSSSLVMPSRVAPLRPPRQRTVLPEKHHQLINLRIPFWNRIKSICPAAPWRTTVPLTSCWRPCIPTRASPPQAWNCWSAQQDLPVAGNTEPEQSNSKVELHWKPTKPILGHLSSTLSVFRTTGTFDGGRSSKSAEQNLLGCYIFTSVWGCDLASAVHICAFEWGHLLGPTCSGCSSRTLLGT